jgi:hypothetical protein
MSRVTRVTRRRRRDEYLCPGVLAAVLVALFVAALLLAGTAQAAKVAVQATNPTQNTDNSPLTDLVFIEFEWGSCNGTAFGVKQASIRFAATTPGAVTQGFVYPTNLTRVCIRAYAINAQSTYSDPSNIAVKDVLGTLSKPVTLGQPVILN